MVPLKYLIDFWRTVLSFEDNPVKRRRRRYFIPSVEIKKNIMFLSIAETFFDQPVKMT